MILTHAMILTRDSLLLFSLLLSFFSSLSFSSFFLLLFSLLPFFSPSLPPRTNESPFAGRDLRYGEDVNGINRVIDMGEDVNGWIVEIGFEP